MKIETKETFYTIYNAFSRRPETSTRPGSTLRKVYGLKLNERFEKVPYVVREYDINDYINSFRDQCDMKIIISRYLAGDPNVKLATNFGNVVNAPDLRAALDIQNRVQTAYNGLSADLKAVMSYEQFISAFGEENNLKTLISNYAAAQAARKEDDNDEQK